MAGKQTDRVEVSAKDEIRGMDAVKDLPPVAKRNRPRKGGSRREKQSIERVRSSLAAMLESNVDNFEAWFAAAAAESPIKALILMKDLAEYFMPKLGRMEQVGEVTHKVQHFVPMIAREARPVEAIDAEFTSSGTSGPEVPKIENKS